MKAVEAAAAWVVENIIAPAAAVSFALGLRSWLGPPMVPGEGALWVAALGLFGWIWGAVANVRDMFLERRQVDPLVDYLMPSERRYGSPPRAEVAA